MIILPEPNNSMWIYDEKEIKEFDYGIITTRKGAIENIPQHSYHDFCHILAEDNLDLPRKWTDWNGGYWDANFEITEIFDSLCVKKLEVNDFCAYVMSWGEVFVFMVGVDSGGYDACVRIEVYNSVRDYNNDFSFSL